MKTYVKPELFYESYELSQHVAACRWDLNQADKTSCYANYDTAFTPEEGNASEDGFNMHLFMQAPTCNYTESDAANNMDYCYTNGAEGSNLLQS